MSPEPLNFNQTNLTLEDAWQRFAKYDKNAGLAQKLFTTQQKAILAIGVAATALAVAYSVLEPRVLPWLGTDVSYWIKQVLRFFVVTTPIVLSILTAWSVKFNMGINWVMLRSGAEALKKEIFFYRTRVGDYSPAKTETESRDVQLARKAQDISTRVMETQVNQTGLLPYKGNLPPLYGTAEGDDGYSDLTPDQFVQYRVEDQFNYYQKKAVRLAQESQRFQWFILILGGVSTALGAFGHEVWIAVSSALATACTSFLESKRVETNLISCNIAADDLYNIRTWWRSLSDHQKEKQENIEALVNGTEAVIQSENAGWVQEMRDALSKLYGETKDENQSSDSSQVSYQSPSYNYSQPGIYGASPDLESTEPSSMAYTNGLESPDDEFSPSAFTNVLEPEEEELSPSAFTNVLEPEDDEFSPSAFTNVLEPEEEELSLSAFTNVLEPEEEELSPSAFTNVLGSDDRLTSLDNAYFEESDRSSELDPDQDRLPNPESANLELSDLYNAPEQTEDDEKLESQQA